MTKESIYDLVNELLIVFIPPKKPDSRYKFLDLFEDKDKRIYKLTPKNIFLMKKEVEDVSE